MSNTLALAGLVGLLLGAAGTAQGPPNLLILVGDDTGADAIGCYNPAMAAYTPNIDRLAARGLRFERAYAEPLCSPTRADLLTGRYTHHHGIRTVVPVGAPGLPLSEYTLPEVAHSAGYEAALVGKWHLGEIAGNRSPNVHGFDHFAGHLGSNVPDYFNWPRVVDGTVAPCTRYATSQEVDDAVAWVAARRKPWVLMVAFHAPHTPFHVPPANLHTQNLQGLDPLVTPRPFWLAAMQAMDAEIGRLLTGIRPVLANTNVVYLGDNGTAAEVVDPPQPIDHCKGTAFEHGVHVPLIVAGPAVQRRGATAALVHVVDLLPTATRLCGGVPGRNQPPGQPLDGVDLVPLLAGTVASVRQECHVEAFGAGFGDAYALIRSDYKLIRFTGGGAVPHEEIYDLRTDPDETNDLLAGIPDPTVVPGRRVLADALQRIDPRGYVLVYGPPCLGASTAIPYQQTAIAPRLGALFGITPLHGSVAGIPVITIAGWFRDAYGGYPLPLALDGVGMPGCTLYNDSSFAVLAGTTGAVSYLRFPADPALVWVPIYAESFFREPGVNPGGFAVSSPMMILPGL